MTAAVSVEVQFKVSSLSIINLSPSIPSIMKSLLSRFHLFNDSVLVRSSLRRHGRSRFGFERPVGHIISSNNTRADDGFYKVSDIGPSHDGTGLSPGLGSTAVVGEVVDHAVDMGSLRPGDTIDVPYEVTMSLGFRDFWQSAFYSYDRIQTSTPFARSLGLQDQVIPFSMMLFLATSMSKKFFYKRSVLPFSLTIDIDSYFRSRRPCQDSCRLWSCTVPLARIRRRHIQEAIHHQQPAHHL